jgi:predicted nucleotidyltransferase
MRTIAVDLRPEAIESYCHKWRIRELAIFGSALRSDFGPESDLDVLVTFEADTHLSLWDVIKAEQELADIVGRPVDLVERSTVEQSENWIRKESVLRSARTVYGA